MCRCINALKVLNKDDFAEFSQQKYCEYSSADREKRLRETDQSVQTHTTEPTTLQLRLTVTTYHLFASTPNPQLQGIFNADRRFRSQIKCGTQDHCWEQFIIIF